MVHPATKVTVIAERMLEKSIIKIINEGGSKGYTILDGQGKGQRGVHGGGHSPSVISGFSIIKIEFVMGNREKAIEVAQTITDRHFKDQSGIVYISTVEVMRPAKF